MTPRTYPSQIFQIQLHPQFNMADLTPQCSIFKPVLDSLIGIVIALAFVILFEAIKRIYKCCRLRGREPGSPHDSLRTATYPPTITTVTTVPRQAVSNMDRDMKLQLRYYHELPDLESVRPHNTPV